MHADELHRNHIKEARVLELEEAAALCTLKRLSKTDRYALEGHQITGSAGSLQPMT